MRLFHFNRKGTLFFLTKKQKNYFFQQTAPSLLYSITQHSLASCITIAHRLETIRQCDRIIVLGNGRVVKEGTYDELIAAGVLQKG